MMRITTAVSLLAVSMILASPARADEESGLSIGLRAAYGLPLGSAGDNTDLANLTAGAVPFQLDVGYRYGRNWQVGAYFGYGIAMVADEAKATLAAQGATDIGGHTIMRAGLQHFYTFQPEARFAPWVGCNAGYEWTRYASASSAGKDMEHGVRGFEGGIQLGGDYKLTPKLTVGPFASFNLGQFQSQTMWVSGSGETATDVKDKAIHEWLQLGIKGTFNL